MDLADAEYRRAARHFGIIKRDYRITAQTDISVGYEPYKNARSRLLETRDHHDTIAWALNEMTIHEEKMTKASDISRAKATREMKRLRKAGKEIPAEIAVWVD